MVKRRINPKGVYDLMENDDGEVMVLLYAGFTEPLNPAFLLNKQNKCIELKRNAKDTVIIEGLKPESIEKLENLQTLYVCELKYSEDEDDDNEIVYAYAAELAKEGGIAKEKQTKVSLSDKVKEAREKVLNKE